MPFNSLLEIIKRLREISGASHDSQKQNELLKDALLIVKDICDDHLAAAKSFIQSPELLEAVQKNIRQECLGLGDYIEITKRFNLEINPRAKDRIVSYGERLSCILMTHLLHDRVRMSSFFQEQFEFFFPIINFSIQFH